MERVVRMNKQEFMSSLTVALGRMPREERYKTLSYYDELIDDRMEDGMTEEEAVSKLGSAEEIARELLGTEPEVIPVEKSTSHRVLTIVLLVLGFPLWGALMLVALSLLLVLYILLLIPVIVLGALALSLFAGALMGLAGMPFLIADAGILPGVFQGGASIFALGLSLLSTVGFYYTTLGVVKAGKAVWKKVVRLFSGKKVIA